MGALCICGGYDAQFRPLASVEALDGGGGTLEAAVWRILPPMAESRAGAVAAAIAGHLYVCGGQAGSPARSLSSLERFHEESKAWELLPPMSAGRANASAVATAGRLYVFGGCGGRHRY